MLKEFATETKFTLHAWDLSVLNRRGKLALNIFL